MAREQRIAKEENTRRSPSALNIADIPLEMTERGNGRRRLKRVTLPGSNGKYPTILIGVGDRALAAAREVVAARNGFSIVGLVGDRDERPSPWLAGFPMLGCSDDLPRIVERTGARAVVVARDDPHMNGLAGTLLSCRRSGVRILDLPSLCERLSGRVPLQHVGEEWLLSRIFSAHRNPLYHRAKRALDIAVSVGALTLFALAFPALAVVIRLSSGGSPLLGQERVGMGGRVFTLYKLRSMVAGAESTGQPVWAESDDGRVTQIGRFLRKTRLDEVPQFWNVLRGEMSVVGPRPERPFFVERLEREIPHYDWRHQVLPGITGWAQVNQGYAASCEASFTKLEYDFYYVKNRSLGLDLRILLRTIGVVLGCRGAR